jgi:ABC-2 type transport system ATP-binding protein
MIKIEHLTKVFVSNWRRRKIRAVDDLNLEIGPGEIYGFLGPNGAGKTTVLKLILGLLFPTSGRSMILGQDSRRLEFRGAVGFLPENPYFYDYLTGWEFLDFYGRLFGLPAGLRRERIARLLPLVDLERAADLRLGKYSKGMLQRIGMAQALINDPRLLILDEPQSGLDPAGRRQIRDLIVKLRAEGKTVFFSSHILTDAEMICDRVGIIHRGRLVASGRLDQLLEAQVRAVELQADGLSQAGRDEIRRLAAAFLESGQRIQFILPGGEGQVPEVLRLIAESGGRLISLVPHRETLEDVFLREVGEKTP